MDLVAVRRAPILTLAVLLFAAKAAQFAIDSTALFCSDSGAFLLNALKLSFLPQRSYVYGYLIRIFALPLHSLRAIVAMQMVMAGITAWLLGFVLLRYLKVRPGIAILAALAFAFDPAQILDEHMVMSETSAALAMAIFLLLGCRYLYRPHPGWLALIALAGIGLVSLRIVYLPPVLVTALALPVAGCFESPAGSRAARARNLALALAVSCAATGFAHWGYRRLTGRLGWREPAYHYATSFYLASSVAPLVKPKDTDDPRMLRAIAETNRAGYPLADAAARPRQLWMNGGFAFQIKVAFDGDLTASNNAADHLARAAIRRDPVGFLRLGIYNYSQYWRKLRRLPWALPWEIGAVESAELLPYDAAVISSWFGEDVSHNSRLKTPTRRFYLWAGYWLLFLLISPFLAAIGACAGPRDRIVMLPGLFFFAWSCLILISACLGAVEAVFRYLHPLSFTGIAAAAVFAEKLIGSPSRGARAAPPRMRI